MVDCLSDYNSHHPTFHTMHLSHDHNTLAGGWGRIKRVFWVGGVNGGFGGSGMLEGCWRGVGGVLKGCWRGVGGVLEGC